MSIKNGILSKVQDHANRIAACEVKVQEQHGIAEQVVTDGRVEFDKVKAQVIETATVTDNKISTMDSRFSDMESKLSGKLKDIDARIAEVDKNM